MSPGIALSVLPPSRNDAESHIIVRKFISQTQLRHLVHDLLMSCLC